jgi:lipopolysaccharide heptosyltransferase II
VGGCEPLGAVRGSSAVRLSRHTDPLELVYGLASKAMPARSPAPDSWRSILILRPCCIGDVLQSTALVMALRQAFPQARLGYAVGPWSRSLLSGNPRIDQLVDTGRVVGGKRGDWRGYIGLVQRLRQSQWDACFVLERSPLFALAALLSGIRDRIGPDSGGRGLALSARVPIRLRRQEAEACLDLARAVGVRTDSCLTEFHPSEEDGAEVDRLLGKSVSRLVVLAPGGGVNPGTALVSKRWPAERYGQLAARLAGLGYTPVVIGGSGDRLLMGELLGEAGSGVTDLCGRLSLTGCGALLKRSLLYVGNDTGVMHLAAAVRTPVVGLFGPTDPAMYAPFVTRQRIIWHPRQCSPCFRQSRRPDCQLECVRGISVDEVEAAALDLLR